MSDTDTVLVQSGIGNETGEKKGKENVIHNPDTSKDDTTNIFTLLAEMRNEISI